MLTFNALLDSVGVDLSSARLVRHRHQAKHQQTMSQDAIRQELRFEVYQSCQADTRVIALLSKAKFLAAFVAGRRSETIFVGLWNVLSVQPGFVPDPYLQNSAPTSGGTVVFDLRRSDSLREYTGRLLVDWGGGERAWVQYAHRRNKRIVELRQRVDEPIFPGFAQFTCALDEVEALAPTWHAALRATKGIYLLVHRATGAQYVGMAIGEQGFLGRWLAYQDGHGGNVGMRELAFGPEQYDVGVLETFGSTLSIEQACEIETLWKRKLGSRAQGLNKN
jgi:hypothetical protein